MIVTAIHICAAVTPVFHVVPGTNDASIISLDELVCSLLINYRGLGRCAGDQQADIVSEVEEVNIVVVEAGSRSDPLSVISIR
jgi:hypothetical protein